MSIRLRQATFDDIDTLQHWDRQLHVTDADPNDDWNWEVELKLHYPWRELLIAELDNQPLGFVQIIDPHEEITHYWGEVEPNLRAIDIWIGEAGNLGKGLGTEMMTLSIDRCFKISSVMAILIDPLKSNSRAIRFYKRLGFRFVENRIFHGDECSIYKLERVDWLKNKSADSP